MLLIVRAVQYAFLIIFNIALQRHNFVFWVRLVSNKINKCTFAEGLKTLSCIRVSACQWKP